MVLLPEEKHEIVRVADIAEFPTALGTRCALLRVLGLDPYVNTEEELLDALTESALVPEMLKICLEDSRCQEFWRKFQEGRTPYVGRDPIRLLEHGGRYWVVEGKHRVCLAKRAGIEALEAVVWHLSEDVMTLLPSVGVPGHYYFRYGCIVGRKGMEALKGYIAFLWVDHPHFSSGFFLGSGWLDAGQDTNGEWKDVLPGVSFRVAVAKEIETRWFFKARKHYTVVSEIKIAGDHPKTKIWLMEVPIQVLQMPAQRLFGAGEDSGSLPACRTVYRYGCWRQRHLKWLSRSMHLRVFNDDGL